MSRVYLEVPFDEKDQAKSLGARWDAQKTKWYVRGPELTEKFARWRPYQHPAGEPLLFVDLVPQSAWFSNLRSELSDDEWSRVKRSTFSRANYCCRSCAGQGPAHPVECHERWDFDEKTGIQRLSGTVALCPDCHESTHIGFASVNGRYEPALANLMRVNGWTRQAAQFHVDQAMQKWLERSEMSWRLDARWLLDFVPLSEPTRQKILAHARGLAQRQVTTAQRRIISGAAPAPF